MGLFVRDECERSMKNQTSKDELVKFATSLREATCKKATYETHDWKLKSHVPSGPRQNSVVAIP